MLKEWRLLFPKFDMIEPTPVGEAVLLKLMELNRFILHLKYPGPRHLVAFSKRMFLDWEIADALATENSERLSGTVIEAVEDGVGGLVVWDCIYYKGFDYRSLPLRERLIKAGEIVKLWKCSAVEEAPLEIDFAVKRKLYDALSGGVILKDIGCPYMTERPRAWLVKR
jgi:hypothetical protein